MSIGAAQLAQVRTAADGWAKTAGFGNAAQVPFAKANELIAQVAKTTKLTPAQVQEALLSTAAVATDTAAAGQKELGTKGTYQGGAVHTPLTGVDGSRPMGALIQARMATGDMSVAPAATTAANELNTVFSKTVEDFEATRIVLTRKATPKTIKEVTDASGKLLMLFKELNGTRDDKQVKTEIVRVYKDLLSGTARNKGVFLTKSTPENPIASFKRVENDPTVKDGPNKVGKDDLGMGASVAFDPATGTPIVYDHQGEVTELASIAEFVTRRAEQFELDEGAGKLEGEPKTVASLRSFTDKEIDALSGKPEFVSLLEDDKNQLTRVYPTKWGKDSGDLLSRRVIVDGPFKGVFLDDVVNELSQRRGKGVDFDPMHGELPTTPKNGEPFITATKVKERGEVREKLMVRIPENREWTEVRRMLRRFSELDPSVKYKQDTGNTTFLFGPEQYKLIRDIVKGTVISGPARDLLQAHFEKLTRIETVTQDKNLANFTPGKIGGFKTQLMGPDGKPHDLDFTYWQKKSIAWLASNNYKGVIALGTGMGKTLVAMGAIQDMRAKLGEKRPLLMVGPPGLGGNMATEALKFLKPEDAKKFNENMQFMDFAEFSKAVRSGTHDGKPFKSEDYGAVVFDEAHKIANRKGVLGAAALAFKHDHKIVMTASALTRGVDETLTLVAIANNKDLNDKVEGKDERYQMRKFTNLHFNVVGGRAVGVKDAIELQPGEKVDPKHNMQQFIRANVLFADKRMDEQKLSKFTMGAETLTMPAAMEEDYRKKSAKIGKIMRGMVSLYRDQGVSREFVDEKGRTKRELNPLAKDKRIAEMFGTQLRGVINELNDVSNTPAKLERAADLITKNMEEKPGTRGVLFSDSPKYVLESAQLMSKEIPGKIHAAALAKEIRFFQNGKELKELNGMPLPFTKKEYTDAASGQKYDENQWQKYVLDKVIGANRDVATTTLFGPVYQEGQNMQWASVGVHLDRDSWSRQNLEQREGRIWRKGQTNEVHFYNVDWVYKTPKDNLDRTLDEVRGLYDNVNAKLFNDVIVVPQKLELGGEWEGVRDSQELRLDRTVLEYAMDPSIEAAATTGGYS